MHQTIGKGENTCVSHMEVKSGKSGNMTKNITVEMNSFLRTESPLLLGGMYGFFLQSLLRTMFRRISIYISTGIKF